LIIFPATFLFSYYVISLTPYGYVTERVYSNPQTQASNDPSDMGGAFLGNRLLYLVPGAGSTNISRDTAIWIEEPRPVKVEKIGLNPEVPISINDEHVSFPPSATITIYPTELLQPNTTYNVSATVAGTPSWWTFTTTSEPQNYRYITYLNPSLPWVAFAITVSSTFVLSLMMWHKKRKTLET
jgi:hypothetical protein